MKSKKNKRYLKQKQRKQQNKINNNNNKLTNQNKRTANTNTLTPQTKKLAAFIITMLSAVNSVSADALHKDWMGALYAENDNQADFGIQFDPNVFYDLSGTLSKIMSNCGHLISETQANWWNDASIDWDSIQTFPSNALYKTQAEAFRTLSEEVWDNLANISVSQPVWDCLHKTIDPECQQNGFTDWALGYQLLTCAGIAAAAGCVGFGIYSGATALCSFWNRSNSSKIQDPESGNNIQPKETPAPTPTTSLI